jgi:hypothetical protein
MRAAVTPVVAPHPCHLNVKPLNLGGMILVYVAVTKNLKNAAVSIARVLFRFAEAI